VIYEESLPPFIGELLGHPGDEIIKNVFLSFWNLLMFISLVSSNVTTVAYGTLLELYSLFSY
jgi:hypothetical protein